MIPPQITLFVLAGVVLLVSLLLVLQLIVTCLRRYCIGRTDRKLLKQPQEKNRSLSMIASAFGAAISKRMRMANPNFIRKESSMSVVLPDSEISTATQESVVSNDSSHHDHFGVKMDDRSSTTTISKAFKRIPAMHRSGPQDFKIFTVTTTGGDQEINKNN